MDPARYPLRDKQKGADKKRDRTRPLNPRVRDEGAVNALSEGPNPHGPDSKWRSPGATRPARGQRQAALVACGAMPGTPPDFDRLCEEARAFADAFCAEAHPELLGITDGKAVGTYIESRFKAHLEARGFFVEDDDTGNAAKGIDLPGLETDIKVTSLRQPQSSAPFKRFQQKIEGLGYNLLLFVYVKEDGEECRIEFPYVRFIPAGLTGDFQTTRYLRQLILENEGEVEDIVAYLQDRNVPADDASLVAYAEELVTHPPAQGYLTISNALQWRLQYKRVVTDDIPGIRDVIAP
jgi:hypothetical protein